MGTTTNGADHAATGPALGFYFQAMYALLILIDQETDDAAISLETLDDIQLDTSDRSLFQLKHSIGDPAPISIKSDNLWKTIRAWIDVFDKVSLPETKFFLVTVAGLAPQSILNTLLAVQPDFETLEEELVEEAERVIQERVAASTAKVKLPYDTKYKGCEAFLNLTQHDRSLFIRGFALRPNSPGAANIEDEVSSRLTIISVEYRQEVARQILRWWDYEVVCSLAKKRPRNLTRTELQQIISQFISEAYKDELVPHLQSNLPPSDYEPHPVLLKQITLVGGLQSEVTQAVRDEWRAREQRSKWIDDRVGMTSRIARYDAVLTEAWNDKHSVEKERCAAQCDAENVAAGAQIFRWALNTAPNEVPQIASGWTAPYYVRGSYQILAIEKTVGWHPNYVLLLEGLS